MVKNMISAILLAAGESKRMGKPKLLMPFGNSTILEQSVDNLLHSRVGEVIVVLGYKAEEMTRLIGGKRVIVTINPHYHGGMSTSILAGISLISDKSDGIMLALADQPLVDSETVNCLIEALDTKQKGIIVPSYRGCRGHPVIFARKYRNELLNLKGDIGGRELIDRHCDDILEVAVDCEGVCIDIDTMDCYRLARSKLK